VDVAEEASVAFVSVDTLTTFLVTYSNDAFSLSALITVHILAGIGTKLARGWLELVSCGAGAGAQVAFHTVDSSSGGRGIVWGRGGCLSIALEEIATEGSGSKGHAGHGDDHIRTSLQQQLSQRENARVRCSTQESVVTSWGDRSNDD